MLTPARIALITGASGGIGSAIARRFAAEGFRLALCGRNTEKLESVRASLPQGTEALLLPGDVNDAGYQDACLAAVQARFGGLDVLVNCAGMAQSDAFEEITPARFDEIMTLNCRTPFFLCQKALCQSDILKCCVLWKKIKLLKNHTDARTVLAKVHFLAAYVHSLKDNLSAGRFLQKVDTAKHRALARAGLSHQGCFLTSLGRKTDVVEHFFLHHHWLSVRAGLCLGVTKRNMVINDGIVFPVKAVRRLLKLRRI